MSRLYGDDAVGTASRGDGGPQKTVLTGLHQGCIRPWRGPAAVSSARSYKRGAVLAGPRRHRAENSFRGAPVGRGIAAVGGGARVDAQAEGLGQRLVGRRPLRARPDPGDPDTVTDQVRRTDPGHAGGPHQERDLDVPLQGRDPLGDRLLTDPQLIGSSLELAGLCDGHERPQCCNIHASTSNFTTIGCVWCGAGLFDQAFLAVVGSAHVYPHRAGHACPDA